MSIANMRFLIHSNIIETKLQSPKHTFCQPLISVCTASESLQFAEFFAAVCVTYVELDCARRCVDGGSHAVTYRPVRIGVEFTTMRHKSVRRLFDAAVRDRPGSASTPDFDLGPQLNPLGGNVSSDRLDILAGRHLRTRLVSQRPRCR